MDLVTGGSGFLGSHIVEALLARGRKIRCLVRDPDRPGNLAAVPAELVTGDLRDPGAMERAVVGCEIVYHCAADYRLYARDPQELFDSNVGGTRNILEAATRAGVRRIVYTSSVAALGLSPDGSPANEKTPLRPEDVIGPYKKSKLDAQRVALDFASRGSPVVIVNPSTPIGERDIKPTPTGRVIVDFLNRRLPAYVDTGLNVIDVRDVAEGHLLAAERARVGEPYILGNRNLTLREILELLSRITGLPAPRVRLPHAIPLAFAAIDTAVARLTGGEPRVSLDSVRMSRHRMFFDSSKAVRELSLPLSPIENAFARAVEWFRASSHVRS
jgi:dihydroflavonol-4-reductase